MKAVAEWFTETLLRQAEGIRCRYLKYTIIMNIKYFYKEKIMISIVHHIQHVQSVSAKPYILGCGVRTNIGGKIFLIWYDL